MTPVRPCLGFLTYIFPPPFFALFILPLHGCFLLVERTRIFFFFLLFPYQGTEKIDMYRFLSPHIFIFLFPCLFRSVASPRVFVPGIWRVLLLITVRERLTEAISLPVFFPSFYTVIFRISFLLYCLFSAYF